MYREIPIDIPEGSELLAVATFQRDEHGELTMRIANVIDATDPLTPEQQARALHLLATGVEAEAIAARSSSLGDVTHDERKAG